MNDHQNAVVLSEPQTAAVEAQEGEIQGDLSARLEMEDLQLLSRFLMGVAILGGEELLQRLRVRLREIDASGELVLQDKGAGDESSLDLLRYFGIGLFARGQNWLERNLRKGYYFSLGASSLFVDALDRITDNPLARPVRQPIEQGIKELVRQVGTTIDEGRQEEQYAKLLASQAVVETMNDVIDYVSESPEVTDLIRSQLGQQSAGLAGVVIENTRRVSVNVDDRAENLIRRLLRLTPRKDLPPSPIEGMPQTMYNEKLRDRIRKERDAGAGPP